MSYNEPEYILRTIGISPTLVAEHDDNRQSLQIVNISDTTIWLKIGGEDPAVKDGIPLPPNCTVKSASEDLIKASVRGVSSVADKEVVVLINCPDVELTSSEISVSGGQITISGGSIDASGSSVSISGPVDVSGSTVDASGSVVDLDPSAEVGLKDGAEVGFVAGSEVGLVDGTEIGLVDGVEVGLSVGAAVDASGSEVSFASDQTVGIKSGSTADIADVKQVDSTPSTSLKALVVQPIGEDGKVIEGGSGEGGIGGGDMVYHSPRDFIATYSDTDELQLSGLPYTPDIGEFQFLKVVDLSDGVTTYYPAKNAFSYNSGTEKLTVAGATFAATDKSYILILFGPDKAYDAANDALTVRDLQPINENTDYELVAEVTDGADGVHDYYIDMEGWSSATILCSVTDCTYSATLHLTPQDDSTPAASCLYVPTGLPPLTNSPDFWDVGYRCKYLKVSIDIIGGGGNGDWTIMVYKSAL